MKKGFNKNKNKQEVLIEVDVDEKSATSCDTTKLKMLIELFVCDISSSTLNSLKLFSLLLYHFVGFPFFFDPSLEWFNFKIRYQ